ncbi:MAG TPA: GH116 family glycosyl hydrolase [Candidatus Omnitrophota bacterium]|nr:GH116 family glycosyl hydrolase [Candidatus Omnitrophota bacterium]
MPTYSSDQNLKSGVPLGGIGAGKIEVLANGLLDSFSFLNNTHNPLVSNDASGLKGVLGFHFAVWVRDKGKKVSKLLSTQPFSGLPCVDSIKYDGSFPFVRLDYSDAGLPVNISLEAFSSFIKNDEKRSSIPAAIFKFRITNPFSRAMSVSLAGIGRNLIGEWCVGRFNQVVDSPKHLGVYFYNKKVQGNDPSSGELGMTVLKAAGVETTYFGEWNMQGAPFVFDKNSLSLNECWSHFSDEGLLPNINTEKVVQSESFQAGAGLAAKMNLRPKSSVTITYVLSWYFPNYGEGHIYETVFRNALNVTNFASEKLPALYADTKAWQKELNSLKIEPWLKDALINNLYPMYSGSMWTKRQRFGLFEAPQVCPLLGTLDVRFYGSLPLALFFPELELKEMTEFAEAQRPQGYIPHDLGYKRSDLASNSTNGLFWKDLNPKFILLSWRDYLMTKDENFLRKMYPFIKKAFYWTAATDRNKDFLPDNEGTDQTFDLWAFKGASSYCSSIFLASLLALEKIALTFNDQDMADEARNWFKKGRASFEKKLWNKKYFIAYNNGKEAVSERELSQRLKAEKVNAACMVGQLTGQWIAHLLGLGYIVSEDRVKKAVLTMLELNGQASIFGAVNSLYPDGEKEKSNLQSENCWFGMTYCLASLAIYEGYVKEELALAKKAWDSVTGNLLNPWNQSDMYSATDGSYIFGDHYMRNMVIWSLIFALAKKDKSIENFLQKGPES